MNDLSLKVRPSDPDAPSDTATEELASRGLGQMGGVPIPQATWDEMAPEHLKWVGENTPTLTGSGSQLLCRVSKQCPWCVLVMILALPAS